jgi:hypothetical protein
MTYSTYEDARAREVELLRSAQKFKIGSEPTRHRRPLIRLDTILLAMREHRAAARKPAVGRAG